MIIKLGDKNPSLVSINQIGSIKSIDAKDRKFYILVELNFNNDQIWERFNTKEERDKRVNEIFEIFEKHWYRSYSTIVEMLETLPVSCIEKFMNVIVSRYQKEVVKASEQPTASASAPAPDSNRYH